MRLGKRRQDAEPAAEPAGVMAPPPSQSPPAGWAVADAARGAAASAAVAAAQDGASTVVEGEAVELPPEGPDAVADAPAPAAAFPVARQPVAVVAAGPEPGGVATVAEAGPLYASGHAHGTAPSWPEPIMQLAAERPELVVAAAFVGGLLLAAIVRRLGS
jgi:hypothetical protein